MITQKEFDKEFGDMMLHGLDSTSTYIPLRINKNAGINVSLRPTVFRLSDGLVLFGGKLRVGYTIGDNHQLLKKSVADINKKVAADRLKNFCKGFAWMKSDARRFSTVVGLGVVATIYDGEKALIILENISLAETFINRLETKYKQYNETGFTANKLKAIQALSAAWTLQSRYVFSFSSEGVATAESSANKNIVGLSSGVLNTAHKNYKGNVLSFADKVAKIATVTVEPEADTKEIKDSE